MSVYFDISGEVEVKRTRKFAASKASSPRLGLAELVTVTCCNISHDIRLRLGNFLKNAPRFTESLYMTYAAGIGFNPDMEK